MDDFSPGLSTLLSPFPAEEFLAEYWPDRALFVPGEPGAPERLVRRLGIPALRDFGALETIWPHDVLALPRRGGDESLGASVQGQAVRWLYEQGHPMFLHMPERVLPRLRQWIVALRHDLGVPAQARVICSTHATRGATETGLHCDPEPSFVLQMSGTKTWWVAPNHSVPHPTQRHALSMAKLHGELASYLERPIPTDVPDDAVEYRLTPGSLLFVPGGWWHATEADTEAFALMFIVKQASWASAVAAALYRRLIRDPKWRRTAIGVGSPNRAFREAAMGHTTGLLASLREACVSMTGADIVMPRYSLSASVRCVREGNRARFIGPRVETSIEFGPDELAIFTAVQGRQGLFSARDVAGDVFHLATVETLLGSLEDLEYLEVE